MICIPVSKVYNSKKKCYPVFSFLQLMIEIYFWVDQVMEESQVCLDGEDLVSISELSKHISDLKDDLRGAQGDLDRLKQEMTIRDSQLEQKTQELKNLTGKVKVIY